MNDSYLQPEIKERFLELPEMVQNIILESGWENTTRRLVEDNNLRIDQGAAIENEVMLTMFGFEKPENFKENIMKETDLSAEEADKIVADINQNVFQLIKDKLILETTEGDSDFSESESEPKPETGAESESDGIKYETNSPTSQPESETGEVTESRDQILSEIEKPEPQMPTKNDIIEENLTKPSVKQAQTKQVDPYREPVE